MSNIYIIIITLILLIAITVFIYYYLYLRKKRHQKLIKSDWVKFEKSSLNNDIKGINQYGTNLMWNVYLDQEILDKISIVVDAKIENYSSLEELRLLIYNKRLNWKITKKHL